MSAVLDELPRPLPTPAQRAHRRSALFVRWLRKIHLWVGLWGALLGLMFGLTGFLMNHRAVMKIPLEKVVQKSAQLKLPQAFDSADVMAGWLQTELGLEALQPRVKADAPRRVTWADRPVEMPERWSISWQGPHKVVNAEYFVGNRFVKVETMDATPIGTLMRLHTANGAGVFWVLLSDTIAGGMVLLSITGLLLWSRLHPMKLTAVGVACAGVLGSVWTLWPAM